MSAITLTAPSYTGSKSSEAMGTLVAIGPAVGATGTPTYTCITEITAVDFSGSKRSVLNPTNMLSGGLVEKLDTLLDNGQIKLSFNRVTSDAGQEAIQSAYTAGGKWNFCVQEPINEAIGQSTAGNQYQFVAIISSGPEFSLDPTKLTTNSYTLDISGALTFIAGS